MATSSWIELRPGEPEAEALEAAWRILVSGQLAVLPTDTGYALSGDALDPGVLERVYRAKARDASKPISVLVSGLEMARTMVLIEPRVQRVIESLLPGALTLVLPRAGEAGDGLHSGGDTLGIRIPAWPFTVRVIERLGRPLTATSANPSGGPSPHRRVDLRACLSLEGVGAVFDAGDLPHGRSSTIVEILPGQGPVVLREGPVDLSSVLAVLGPDAPACYNRG